MHKPRISNLLPGALCALLLALAVLPVEATARPELALDQYSGKVVYLDFWASWCVPCRRSFPWMNAMRKKYADDGLVIITVNVDAERAKAEEFLAEHPAGFEVVYDPDGELASDWQLLGMPNSFLVNRDGEVISRHVGFRSGSEEKLETEIRAALGLDERVAEVNE